MRRAAFFASALSSVLVALACDGADDSGPAPGLPGAADAAGGGVGPSPGPTPLVEGGSPDAAADATATDGSAAAAGALWSETHTTCALRAGGKAVCWGANGSGQLGDGTADDRLAPVEVLGLADALEVGPGSEHTCALHANGTVSCWGRATDGTLGDGIPDAQRLGSLARVQVKGLTDAVDLETGDWHTCVRRAGGTVACWGENVFGKLGDGTNDSRYEPVQVVDLTDAVEISASFHTCARRATGSVVCWGPNGDGQLGNGTFDESYVPVPVVGLTDAVEISTGSFNTCARRANGRVVCWGVSRSGRLGTGVLADPVEVAQPGADVEGLTDAVQISVGNTSTCALRATGSVVCWGSNNYGQVGNGRMGDDVWSPTPVVGLTDAVGVAVGQWHACARRATGAVVCWGENGGAQRGDGTKQEPLQPTTVAGLP